MNFSPQQDKALIAVDRWLKSWVPGTPPFKLFGYAGTGKTTIAKHIAANAQGRVMFAAFTGKAASVLQQKGCMGATTIHRLIYLPSSRSKARLLEMQRLLGSVTGRELEQLQTTIKEEEEMLKQPYFSINPDSPIRSAKLLIIDECSMLGKRIGEDLLSYDVPILVLGDPAQLPPVRGAGFFTNGKPHALLTEIHRQAKGSPVIELATKVRKGEDLVVGQYGSSRVLSGRPDPQDVLAADQIIVGRNATRRSTNRRIRELNGMTDVFPLKDEKLVCLRNDHEEGLLNGEMWWTTEDTRSHSESLFMKLIQDQSLEEKAVWAHPHHFEGREIPFWERREAQEFDYGYALTCHKSQGSQWGNVFIFDESWSFRNDRRNWLYTAITRASDSVTVCLQN